MKRLMRPATCGTSRYAPNSPAPAAPASPSTQIIRMPAMKNSAPHTIRISMVWPKSGSITNSDTSVSSSTSAIEVAGISGRLRRFRKQPRRHHDESGLCGFGSLDVDADQRDPASRALHLWAEQQRRHDQRDR